MDLPQGHRFDKWQKRDLNPVPSSLLNRLCSCTLSFFFFFGNQWKLAILLGKLGSDESQSERSGRKLVRGGTWERQTKQERSNIEMYNLLNCKDIWLHYKSHQGRALYFLSRCLGQSTEQNEYLMKTYELIWVLLINKMLTMLTKYP